VINKKIKNSYFLFSLGRVWLKKGSLCLQGGEEKGHLWETTEAELGRRNRDTAKCKGQKNERTNCFNTHW